jgi:hypothetical protein
MVKPCVLCLHITPTRLTECSLPKRKMRVSPSSLTMKNFAATMSTFCGLEAKRREAERMVKSVGKISQDEGMDEPLIALID